MHKQIQRLRGMLFGKRAHAASLLALAMAWYALVLYVPAQLVYGNFYLMVIGLIVVCLALAVHNFIAPERWGLLAMGGVLVALLGPGPLYVFSVQNVSAGGDIMRWVSEYTVLVAGAAAGSYLSFKAAGERKRSA
jgi:hypothetical protein